MTAVDDQAVGERCPIGLRQQLRQILFDFHRIRLAGESKATSDPSAVGIDRNPGDSKSVAKNYVGGFAADTGKPDEFVHRRRHGATEFMDQLLGATLERSRLCPKQPQGPDNRFDLAVGSAAKRLRIWPAPEKFRSNPIHRRIRALSGKDHGDE